MTGMADRADADYRYADPGDALTIRLIADSGLSMAEWEHQESAVLDAAAVALSALEPRRALLDVGSGYGRLSLRFAGLFDRVVSIEPDPDRARGQAERIAGTEHAGRIEVRTEGIDDAGRFDAVLCSHVLQHVATGEAEDLLELLATALRPDGLLLLTTAGSTGAERFTVMRLSGGGLVEDDVSRAEFDLACRQNTPGHLPVHYFSGRPLLAALRRRRLEPTVAYGFHGRPGEVVPLSVSADDPAADPGPYRDIAVLARRR
jgi:SAM-dependent methyltransferase